MEIVAWHLESMTDSASVFEEMMAYRKQGKNYIALLKTMNEGKMNFHSKSICLSFSYSESCYITVPFNVLHKRKNFSNLQGSS